MKVKIKKEFTHSLTRSYVAGEIVEVDDELANRWIATDLAVKYEMEEKESNIVNTQLKVKSKKK